MSKLRKHIRKLHKIKVHHNRWFIWAISIIFIVCLSLLSYIKISNLWFDQSLVDASILYHKGSVYNDSYLGFSLRHPSNWGIEARERNIITFNDPLNYGQSLEVGVYKVSDEKSLRKAMDISNEQNIIVAKTDARMLTVADANGLLETVVLVKHADSLYVIRGNTPWFDRILDTFTFTETKNN